MAASTCYTTQEAAGWLWPTALICDARLQPGESLKRAFRLLEPSRLCIKQAELPPDKQSLAKPPSLPPPRSLWAGSTTTLPLMERLPGELQIHILCRAGAHTIAASRSLPALSALATAHLNNKPAGFRQTLSEACFDNGWSEGAQLLADRDCLRVSENSKTADIVLRGSSLRQPWVTQKELYSQEGDFPLVPRLSATR